ncbi:MAG: DUF2284 domain-containing protein [Thermovenabulum sp.]|uniref:DUF2284 domain-containing protein n=1 Tax=Thermovenabulum sp. TaxID=3100335 RepID=UPI003C7ECDDB
MDLIQKFENAKKVLEFAKSCEGVTDVRLIDARDIVVDDRVRFQCSHSGCREYGKRFMCPPKVPDVEEFKKVLAHYIMALLIQIKGPAEDVLKLSKLLHNAVYKTEKKAFSLGFPFAAGLIGGPCNLCEKCPEGENARCINREKARPSMEAMGIDVLKTCKNAGMNLEFKNGEITWTGLVLID